MRHEKGWLQTAELVVVFGQLSLLQGTRSLTLDTSRTFELLRLASGFFCYKTGALKLHCQLVRVLQ